jgi:hypothetical protein
MTPTLYAHMNKIKIKKKDSHEPASSHLQVSATAGLKTES